MSMENIDFEILKALAEMQGERTEVREDGCIVMTDDCPTYGGTYWPNTQQGIEEAINFYTYCNLNPLTN